MAAGNIRVSMCHLVVQSNNENDPPPKLEAAKQAADVLPSA